MPSTAAAALHHQQGKSVASICRLCFMEREQLELIFVGANGDVTEWIEKLTSLKIVDVPNAPASLCSDCKSTLEAFDAFREMCITNDLVFKETFSRDADYWAQELHSGEIKTESDEDQAVEQGGNLLVMCEIPSGQEEVYVVPNRHGMEEYEVKVHDIDTGVESDVPQADLVMDGEGHESALVGSHVAGMELTMVDDAVKLAGRNIEIDSSVESDDEEVAEPETEDSSAVNVVNGNGHMPHTLQAVLLDTCKYTCKICNFTTLKLHSRLHLLTHTEPELFVCCVCSAEFKHFKMVKKHIHKWHRKNHELVVINVNVERTADQITEIDDDDEADDVQGQVIHGGSDSVSAPTSSVTVGDYEIITEIEVDSSVEDGEPVPAVQRTPVASMNKAANILPLERGTSSKHKCKVCNINTSMLHVMTHRAERTFRCYICMKKFDKMVNCSKHISGHKKNQRNAGEANHICKICKASKSKLHVMTHKAEGFQCHICKRMFDKMEYVSKHIKVHLKNRQKGDNLPSKAVNRNHDRITNATSASSKDVRGAKPTQHGMHIDSSVESDDCPSNSNTDGSSKPTYKQFFPHTYDCKICQKFVSRVHIMTHKSKRSFVCYICSEEFDKLARVSKHIKKHGQNGAADMGMQSIPRPSPTAKRSKSGKSFPNPAPPAMAAGSFAVKQEKPSIRVHSHVKGDALPSIMYKAKTDGQVMPPEPRLTVCKICQTNVSKLHVMAHKAAGVFKCPYCRKQLLQFGSVSKHILRCHR